MRIVETTLPGALIVEPKVFADQRGFFFESYQEDRYAEVTKGLRFVQDNVSQSSFMTFRGLHLQNPNPQGKLVQVLLGEVLDVAVDVRVGSPCFGQSVCVELSAGNKRQFYIPPGFAHGFLVISPIALFSYKCTSLYSPGAEISILWNDPDLDIFKGRELPTLPTLSQKDSAARRLKDIKPEELPRFEDFIDRS